MKEKTMVRNMAERSIPCHLSWFALPLMLANCLQALYTTVDTLVVGRVVGTAGLSAVSNCAELITFYTMIAIGFSSAGQIIIAQYVGKEVSMDASATGQCSGGLHPGHYWGDIFPVGQMENL